MASIKATFIATAFGLFEEFHIWLTVTTGFPVAGMIIIEALKRPHFTLIHIKKTRFDKTSTVYCVKQYYIALIYSTIYYTLLYYTLLYYTLLYYTLLYYATLHYTSLLIQLQFDLVQKCGRSKSCSVSTLMDFLIKSNQQ